MKIVWYIFMLAIAPFFIAGVIVRIKSMLAGRKGPPLLQPFHDFFRLLRKSEVTSVLASPLFVVYPAFAFACALFASILIPTPFGGGLVSFEGDIVVFAYIFAFSRFLGVLSALETGSSFEGMGSSREATFSLIIEPGFFLLIGTLAISSGQLSFGGMFVFAAQNMLVRILLIVLVTVILFLMILTEACRVPVDDPNTHLELTMIHEVMILDNSGPGLALINYSVWLKTVIFSSLIASAISPVIPLPGAGVFVFMIVMLFIAILIGCIESIFARIRMTHVPQFILLVTSLAIIALFISLFVRSGGVL